MGYGLTISELPVWRRTFLFVCVGLFCTLGLIATFEDVRIYAAAPTSPVVVTKQVSPVYPPLGGVRYVSFEQEEKLIFWKEKLGLLVGIPFVLALLAVITPRDIKAWAGR